MTDTIQKIADEMAACIDAGNGSLTVNSSRVIGWRDRLRALSARASAGEGGWPGSDPGYTALFNAIAASTSVYAGGVGINVSVEKFRAALTATPQPAQAGASGGGEYEVRKGRDGEWGIFARGYNLRLAVFARGSAVDRDKIAAKLTTPASPATGGDPPFVDDKITIADVAGVLGEMAENFDGGEYTISEETRCVLIDFAHGITQHDLFSIIEYHFKQKYATPQPESAGEWDSFDERAVKFAVHPQQATCKDSLQVPPAHGDGEGLLVHVGDALSHAFPEDIAEWKRVCRIVYPFLRERLTTRPTPEAQEARDAVQWAHDEFEDKEHVARVRGDIWLADYYGVCKAKMAAALALPAQGEGNRG